MQVVTVKSALKLLWNREIFIFFSIGILQLIIDTMIMFLLAKSGLFIGYANIFSRAIAAIIGCYLNYSTTFKENKRSTVMTTFFKFIPFWILMTCLSSTLITIIPHAINTHIPHIPHIQRDGVTLIIVKLLTEGFLFVISYFISKNLIFRRHYGL